jgi:mono/diheme cytochrome c family protein
MKQISSWIMLLFLSVAFFSCSYDNEEDLYGNEICDTSSVTYSKTIKPVLTANCYSCHSTSNAPSFGSGIKLENYDDLMVQVNNGKLVGAITHSPGYPAMPQGGAKLDDCPIEKIVTWINNGAPNN